MNDRQIEYWAHMLDEAMDKEHFGSRSNQALNESAPSSIGYQKRVEIDESKISEVPKEWYSKITAQMVDEYWPPQYISDYFVEVLNGTTSLNEMRDNILSFIPEYQESKYKVSECDGGGGAAAGGDAGGAAGGDGGTATPAASGDAAAGTSVGDVLGNCDHSHGEGYFGPACFHVPSKAAVPFHRWEIGNGGSKRKKDKKGRDKKYAYEKGMKVVVDMFEEDEEDN